MGIYMPGKKKTKGKPVTKKIVTKKVAKKTPSKSAKTVTKKAVKKTVAKKTLSKSAVKNKVLAKKTVLAKKIVKAQRSFKVKLPESETFEGRFTGLTPYQAANKALSSYYRANTKSKVSFIMFTIKESTRGSKRNEYTYNGKREKLSTPVEYTIKCTDGTSRTITKAFKNRLTKIKKAELAKLAQAQAQAQTQA